MKKHFFKLLLVAILILIPFSLVKAETLSKKLSGKILLQVESRGEAWYVNPINLNRYYMANGNEAYNIMRNFGVGITDVDLGKIKNNKVLALKHKGKIFLQVESRGEAYYVDFSGNLYYLKNGDAAYEIMRSLGLGITNTNLAKISEATSSPSQISQDNQDSQYITPQKNNVCISWAYSDWSSCISGLQTRTITSYSPSSCTGGTPVLSQNCSIQPSICSSNWQCGAWSSCSDSQQTRFCNDLNNCNIENQKPAITQACTMPIEETYVYHDYYPIILSLSDNYGTIIKNSGYNNYKGYYSKPFSTNSLKIGDIIHIKVESSDPKNRPISYLWDSTNADFRQKFNDTERGQLGNWTSNNEINYTITEETLKNSGELFRIVVSIKTEKENFRNTSPKSNYWDDEIFIDYNLTIPIPD